MSTATYRNRLGSSLGGRLKNRPGTSPCLPHEQLVGQRTYARFVSKKPGISHCATERSNVQSGHSVDQGKQSRRVLIKAVPSPIRG